MSSSLSSLVDWLDTFDRITEPFLILYGVPPTETVSSTPLTPVMSTIDMDLWIKAKFSTYYQLENPLT